MAAEPGRGCLPLHPDAGSAERDEPDADEQEGEGHHAVDELANRSSVGDLGDEHSNKRTPGDPPTPVEDGPAVHPAIRAISRLNSEIVVEVIAGVGGKVSQDIKFALNY